MKHNQTFIAFVDCVVKGDWKPIRTEPGTTVLGKQALNDKDCFVDVLQLNVVRRYLHFKKGAIINIMGNVLLYDNAQLKEEVAVDEDKQK